ncbi:hypothetical protein NDU88_004953, partial [Pleurodeles waltl]
GAGASSSGSPSLRVMSVWTPRVLPSVSGSAALSQTPPSAPLSCQGSPSPPASHLLTPHLLLSL